MNRTNVARLTAALLLSLAGVLAPGTSAGPAEAAMAASPRPAPVIRPAMQGSPEASGPAVALPPFQGITSVSAGLEHTCAVADGRVLCWGSNFGGQLGDGTWVDHGTPAPVEGLAGAMMTVAAGDQHSCAVTSTGQVWCWGSNGDGQLGDGTTRYRLTPVLVSGLTAPVSAIAAGEAHTCALTAGGAVWCWGDNRNGQLGNGTVISQRTPVAVQGLASGVTAITAGESHSCAVTGAGAAVCWGDNWRGQLGDGTNDGHNTPVQVSGLGNGVTDIAAGLGHTCAVTGAGAVKCWGSNGYSQLGDGTVSSRKTPVAVSGLSGVTAVAAGRYHTCARTTSGAAKCWGSNVAGQLGDGSTVDRSAPVPVSGLGSGVAEIAAGGYHTCGRLNTGGLSCWGSNRQGMLGDGTLSWRIAPFQLPTLTSGVSALAASEWHTCALSGAGAVKCWGSNALGQLGDNSYVSHPTPTAVAGLASGVTALAAGGYHVCALTGAGGVLCWGYNSSGQLGDGTTTEHAAPAPVSGLVSGVRAIAAGVEHTCALTSGGGVLCWGSNSQGQLGDGSTDPHYTPAPVSGLGSGVTSIIAGGYHTCALTVAGGVWCWGYNSYGELGDGSFERRTAPVALPGLAAGVAAIGAGLDHTCAAMSAGGARCWGRNGSGQLGDGTTSDRNTPTPVQGLTGSVAAFAHGEHSSCARTAAGAVLCWGANWSGQLGDGTVETRLTAVPVVGLSSGVTAIASGERHVCVVSGGGAVRCWGWDGYGQLGLGTILLRTTPVTVVGRLNTRLPLVQR